MQTNRQELIGQLRAALGQLENPKNEEPVEIEILDLEFFCFEQDFLNESEGLLIAENEISGADGSIAKIEETRDGNDVGANQ